VHIDGLKAKMFDLTSMFYKQVGLVCFSFTCQLV